MAALLAVQPAGFLVLLALSIVHHVSARTMVPPGPSSSRGGASA